ncbi:MAG: phosphate/phosphite/phosphonate ABC transporter substrate-binding protein [Frankiales bacterium]|nr:phosphate/phosphite/phosphonate ABC transporter substrate-binding protein [Frankiales bacterium]
MTLFTSACGGSSSASVAADPAACPNGKVRFGIEPYEDPSKLTPAYTVMAKALEKGLGCPVELTIVADYAAEVLAMKNGKLDIAQFGPLGYVFASQNAQAEPMASFGDANGTLSSYKAGIWVKKDSPIQALTDLKGKTLALSSIGSTSGDALPRYALQQAGIAQSDLKVQYAGGHSQALLALTNGAVDAAEINTQKLATAITAKAFNPENYRRVWESAAIPNDPITVRADLPSAFKDKAKAVLTGLSPSDVAAVGKYLDVDPAGPMIAVTKATYQPLFDLAVALKLTQKDV